MIHRCASKHVLVIGQVPMQIDEITSNLEERGFWWQASGFGLIGAVTLTVLSVYSDSNLWIIDSYRMAVTQLQWTLVAPIVAILERIRMLFEKRSEIRRVAREEAIAKAEAKGEKRGIAIGEKRGVAIGEERGRLKTLDRLRAEIRERGYKFSPEDEDALFGSNGHER